MELLDGPTRVRTFGLFLVELVDKIKLEHSSSFPVFDV